MLETGPVRGESTTDQAIPCGCWRNGSGGKFNTRTKTSARIPRAYENRAEAAHESELLGATMYYQTKPKLGKVEKIGNTSSATLSGRCGSSVKYAAGTR